MTRKLYDENAYMARFSARVLSCEPAGDGFAVVLDATAFFPEGGGQLPEKAGAFARRQGVGAVFGPGLPDLVLVEPGPQLSFIHGVISFWDMLMRTGAGI